MVSLSESFARLGMMSGTFTELEERDTPNKMFPKSLGFMSLFQEKKGKEISAFHIQSGQLVAMCYDV